MIKFQTKYRRIKQIGSGCYGKVYLGKDTTDNTHCVVKAIDCSKMHPKEEEMCLNEIKIMETLNHPFVIGIRDSLVVKKSIVIVMDLAEGNQFLQKIISYKKNHRWRSRNQTESPKGKAIRGRSIKKMDSPVIMWSRKHPCQ